MSKSGFSKNNCFWQSLQYSHCSCHVKMGFIKRKSHVVVYRSQVNHCYLAQALIFAKKRNKTLDFLSSKYVYIMNFQQLLPESKISSARIYSKTHANQEFQRPAFSSGASSIDLWTCWSGSRGEQQRKAGFWSICPMDTGWGCSAWRRHQGNLPGSKGGPLLKDKTFPAYPLLPKTFSRQVENIQTELFLSSSSEVIYRATMWRNPCTQPAMDCNSAFSLGGQLLCVLMEKTIKNYFNSSIVWSGWMSRASK